MAGREQGSGGILQEWMDNWGEGGMPERGSNPAAPGGTSDLLESWARDNGFTTPQGENSSALQAWSDQNGFSSQARRWYTGANAEGVQNGWDSKFYDEFAKKQNEAMEKGELADYFGRPDATGVVSWDHEVNGKKFAFGDVVENGQKVANVYEDFGRDGGNMMMAQLVLEDRERLEVFKEGASAVRRKDDTAGDELDKAVQTERDRRSREIPMAKTARQFEEGVQDRAESMGEGGSRVALIAGATAASAGLGAGVGSVVPVIGTGLGLIAGGAVGLFGALTNQDEIAETAARAYEVTALSDDQHNMVATAGTFVEQWARVGGKFFTPISNVSRGIYELTSGDIGDDIVEARKIDPVTGEVKTPGWMKVADVGTMFADAALQFLSPIGVAAFTAQMAGQILGSTTGMAASGGETFDDRRGDFDNVFTDEDGNFSPMSAAAGIANIGIDVVQLGMARGLAGSANASKVAVGDDAVYTGLLQKPGEFASRILPRRLGGESDKAKAAAARAGGGQSVQVGGYKYTLDESGKAVSRRGTASLLAPSEQLSAVTVGNMARRQRAVKDGAVSADDYYRAAQALSTGRNQATNRVLVNAFGEGVEEAAQAVLEPISHEGQWSAGQIAEAFMYGAAMGAGMTAATNYNSASADKKLDALAQYGYKLQNGGADISEAEVRRLSEQERRGLAAVGVAGKNVGEAALKKIQDDLGRNSVAGTAGFAKANDAIQRAYIKALNRGNIRTDGAFTMTQHENVGAVDDNGNLLPGSIPGDSVSASAVQTLANLTHHLQGVNSQRVTMKAELAELPADAPAEARELIANRIAMAEQVQIAGGRLFDSLAAETRTIYDLGAGGGTGEVSADRQMLESTVAVMNEKLRRAFTGLDPDTGAPLQGDERTAMMRASTIIFARDPHEGSASYMAVAPHVSFALTEARADNVIQTSPGILASIRGDYDGDKMRPLNQLILDDEGFVNLRTGRNFLGVGSTVNIKAPDYEKWIVEFLAEGLNSPAGALQQLAQGSLLKIHTAMRARYGTRVEASVLDRVLTNFDQAVRANDKDARSKLLDGLATMAPEQMGPNGAPNELTNEWLWIDQLVRSVLNDYQEVYAAQRPIHDLSLMVPGNEPTPVPRTPQVDEARATRAATPGQTMAMRLSGTSLFRKFQKLHYSVYNSPVVSGENFKEDTPFTERDLIEFYEELSQQISQSELDRVRGEDDVTRRAFVMLERVAASFMQENPGVASLPEAMVLVANIKVQDISFATDGSISYGKEGISTLQQLLKLSLSLAERDSQGVLEADPALQAKYAKLRSLTYPGGRDNAEKAFLEVFGSYQMYWLLGDSAAALGAHLTMEQYLRQYVALPEYERRALKHDKLTKEPEYLGSGGHHKLPYTLAEAFETDRFKISAYRVVVDSIMSVGNHRITIDENGNLKGELADRSAKASSDLKSFVKNSQAAIREIQQLKPSTELTVDLVRDMLEAHPDFARQMYELLPASIAPVAFREDAKGTLFVSDWFYKTLTFETAEEAEMHILRNLLMSQWVASGLSSHVGEDSDSGLDTELKGRRFANIKSRTLRVMYAQLANDRTGARFSQFMRVLTEATDVTEFYKFLNTEPGIRGRQAPLVPWFDDTAEFDVDKAGGGWAASFQGAELREAITALQKGSVDLLKTVAQERSELSADLHLLAAAKRALDERNGKTVALVSGDREALAQLEKVIELAGDSYTGLSSNVMIDQTVSAAMGIYGQGHTKGKSASHVRAAGALEAWKDALGHITNHERMVASLTAVNLDDIARNMEMLAKDDHRTMDDFGRQIEATRLTAESFIEQYSNPDTRAKVRAQIFPHVMDMDPSGALKPRLLLGKSLKDLLAGKAYQDLFPVGDRMGTVTALKYIMAVEAEARRFKGDFSVQRFVNDLVIARTAASRHTISEYEMRERYVIPAYVETAQLLQKAAALSLAATPGSDPLAELTDVLKKAQRQAFYTRVLGLEQGETLEDAETFMNVYMAQMAEDAEVERQTLNDQADAATDPAEREWLLERMAQVQRDLEATEQRTRLLIGSTDLDVLVESTLLPATGDITPEVVQRRDMVLQEVRQNLRMIELVPAARPILMKLKVHLEDPSRQGQPNLTQEEWHNLSRAVIAMRIKDHTEYSGNNVQVPLFPLDDNRRYIDTAFTYLIDKAVDPEGPLLLAAKSVAARAGRMNDGVTTDEFVRTVERTVFDNERLGKWHSLIPAASMEANDRLTSASAEPAVSMPGNAPKRKAAVDAATARTYLVPDESMVSTLTVKPSLLRGSDVFREIKAQIAGFSEPRTVALAELNNRFASSVMATMADGSQVELLQQPNVGLLPLLPNDRRGAVASSGFSAIHLDRINSALEALAVEGQEAVSLTINFLHPDSQPAAEGWYNNVFFEGLNFTLNADMYQSLIGGLYFAPGGIAPEASASALDAAKKGMSALQAIDSATAAERMALEFGWETDFSGMLRAKVKQHMSTDLGFGALNSDLYNGVLKEYKLRHFVLVPDAEGANTLLTAEQVIEMQRAGTPLPEGSKLWIAPDRMLLTMLGDQSGQGIPTVVNRTPDYRIDRIKSYQGVPAEFLARFPEVLSGDTVPLESTRIINRAREYSLMVSVHGTESQMAAHETRMQRFRHQADATHRIRALTHFDEKRGFDPTRNYNAALAAGTEMIQRSRIQLSFRGISSVIAPRNEVTPELNKALLRGYAVDPSGLASGFVYRQNGPTSTPNGVLNSIPKSGDFSDGMDPVFGDVVVVDTGSFAGDMDAAWKVLEYFTNRGVTLVLAAADGTQDLSTDLGKMLNEEIGYGTVPGSSNIYQPLEIKPFEQTRKALESTLVEVESISPRDVVTILKTIGMGIHESSLWYDPNSTELGAISQMRDIIPVATFGDFNVPVPSVSGPSQVAAVIDKLNAMNTPEGIAHIQRMAARDAKPDQPVTPEQLNGVKKSFQDMIVRINANQSLLHPEGSRLNTGDFIPLVNSNGEILLHRIGYRAPNTHQLQEQLAIAHPGDERAVGVAVYSLQDEPASSNHDGIVRSWSARSGYGLSVLLDIPLQEFGNKVQFELNGMKYLLTPKPDEVVMPDHGIFPGRDAPPLSDYDTAASKESERGEVNNARNAIAYFGMDFLPDVTEFFFPGKGQDGISQQRTRDLLDLVARRSYEQIATIEEIIRGGSRSPVFQDVLNAFAQEAGIDPSISSRMQNETDPSTQIATAMIMYLMTPGARVEHVLSSGGFGDTSSPETFKSRLMPRIFTQIFDNAEIDSPLRKEFFRRLNAQIYNPKKDGTGYLIDQFYNFHVLNKDPKKNMVGYLQFSKAHSSGDNPALNGMAFVEGSNQAISAHSAWTAHAALGAVTAGETFDYAKARLFGQQQALPDLERDRYDGGMWRMLTRIPEKDETFRAWAPETALESRWRAGARDKRVRFRELIDKTDTAHWSAPQRQEYEKIALGVVHKLNLKASQVGIVDAWVRQFLGRPAGGLVQGDDMSFVTGHWAIEAAKQIQYNVDQFYMPTFGGMVGLIDQFDLQLIHRANRNLPNGWRPRASVNQDSMPVNNYDDWVNVALGTFVATQKGLDPAFLQAADGFMHTYQTGTGRLTGMPVSSSVLKIHELINPDNNALVASLSNPQSELMANPSMAATVRMNVDELLGGRKVGTKTYGRAAPSAVMEKRLSDLVRWRKENDMPMPLDVTMRDFRKNGLAFVDQTTTTNALFRGLINLRVGMTLLNPALYVAMIPEQFYRQVLDTGANLLSGQSTGVLGGVAARSGLSQYTPEQVKRLRQLYSVMGQRSNFKAMVYGDLMYQRPFELGSGKVGRFLESFARLGARWQDPTWGVRADALARRYVEAAIEHIYAAQTTNTITTDQLISQLMVNPEWLRDAMPDAHRAASNALAQMRSLKQTTMSAALSSVVDTLSESSKMRYNIAGNLLRIPLLFRGYALNVATTLLGLQGFSDMAAMFLDGRDKPGLIRNIQKSIKGEAYNEETDAQFDMSQVIEGIDLSRSFIRSGLNISGLFALGMMAGGLGLSGEDEEAKRRRRAAEYQGAGFTYDPRLLENDFRNSDVVFLDWLPSAVRDMFGKQVSPDGAPGGDRHVAKMHWTLRQFISPIIGIEKFFDTGDFRQVQWGFEDAIGSMPIINSMMWKDVNDTVSDLNAMAQKEQQVNGPLSHVKTANFLMTAVSYYEAMLFENAFLNTLYTGRDRLDRDPFARAMTNSVGETNVDVQGNPRPSEGLETYIDPETGEVRQGYVNRSAASAELATLTENRATLAVVASLFSGFSGGSFTDNDYLRENMVPKIRSFDKPTLTEEEQSRVLLDIARAGMQQPTLTTAEATSILRNYIYETTGSYKGTSAEQLLPEAEKMAATFGRIPLSELDPDGDEILTDAGARAVYQGLVKGSVKVGDASLANIYISPETRKKIQAEWTQELVKEGIDLGLDETKAQARMMRIMAFGDPMRPEIPPLKDIIWNKQISFSKTSRYQQLNTTYVMGPDGLPWATGWARDSVLDAIGLRPLKKPIAVEDKSMNTDILLNSVDDVAGRNLGLRALERLPEVVPTEQEIAKSLEDALQGAANRSYTPNSAFNNNNGGFGGYGGYSRFGRRRGYGGGGGGGYSGYANWRNMFALPEGRSAFSNSVPFINTTNPIIRRADIRRERVWSDRGRLNQWQ